MHYVISDIHGQWDMYRQMLEMIGLNPEDTLYILGDVIDRGPDSISILKDLMQRENAVMFLGNHELMMLDHLSKNGEYHDSWTLPGNGGKKTKAELLRMDPQDRDTVIRYILDAWIQKYVEVDGEMYALMHSCFVPEHAGKDLKFLEAENWTSVFNAVWSSPWRMWEYADPKEYSPEYTYVIGHVPVQATGEDENVEKPPYILGNIINIDGGCALLPKGYPGGLFCMTLEKDETGKRQEFWIPGKPAKKFFFL